MAWTVSTVANANFGNLRSVHLKCTADAATQTIETGLDSILSISHAPASLSTGAVKIYPNSNASGVQSMGVLGCSGFVSGDVLYVTCYGV